jgi:uncharacterized membrane protein (UPF0136 family)
MHGVEHAEAERDRSWQDTFDLILLAALACGEISRIAGFLSARQSGVGLVLVFGIACAGYLVSALRGDPDRPAFVVPLAIYIPLYFVLEFAFGRAWPQWIEALTLLAVLLFFLAPRGDPSTEQPLRNIDPRPPY